MTKAQLEVLVKDLKVENEELRLQLKQKNTRNAGRKPYISASEVTRMKKMRDEGKSYAYIGQAFGVSSTAVYNKLNSTLE
jgi:DNA invertase Pin-like site-specific DNA recombinase